jgi:hypothetical protein
MDGVCVPLPFDHFFFCFLPPVAAGACHISVSFGGFVLVAGCLGLTILSDGEDGSKKESAAQKPLKCEKAVGRD